MKEIINYLTELGFSKVEIKIYLTLLKYGSVTIAELAEKAKINRTAAYGHVDSLFKKGVLLKTKGKRNEISANSPESLKYLVESKSSQAKNLETKLPSILNVLHISFPSTKNESSPDVVHYKGKTGVLKIYAEALKSIELRSYVNFEILRKTLPENESNFPDELKKNKSIKIYEILEDSPTSRKILEEFNISNENSDRCFFKFLPQGVKLSSVDILIYDGKVAIINVQKELIGIVLKNAEYYENSKQLFDLLWKVLK